MYHRCNDTPLSVFIDCLVDGNYKSLVRWGRANRGDIGRAWEAIYSEYNDINGNPASKILINLSKDIAYHDAKLRAVGLCLKVLQHHPDPRCIDVLRKYGYHYSFDITDREGYVKDLEAVATRTGAIVVTLEIKKKEYEAEASKVTGKPMTRERWYDLLAVIGEHFSYALHPTKFTVSEFVAHKKRFNDSQAALRRQHEKASHGSKG